MQRKQENIRVIFVLGMAQKLLLPSLLKDQKFDKTYVLHSVSVEKCNLAVFINIKPKTMLGWAKCFKSVQFLRLLVHRNKDLIVYLPHAINFLSNYFSRVLTPKETFLLYDGILNFRSLSWGDPQLQQQIRKQKVKSAFFLLDYKPFDSQVLVGQEGMTKALLVPEGLPVERLKYNGSVELIKLDLDNDCGIRENIANEEVERLLILEPPDIHGSLLNKFHVEIERVLNNSAVKEVLIKMHPSKKNSMLDESIFLSKKISILYVTNSVSAEEIYSDFLPKHVISTNSSALLNIKCFFPTSNVIGIGESFESIGLLEIKDIFKDCGVKIV